MLRVPGAVLVLAVGLQLALLGNPAPTSAAVDPPLIYAVTGDRPGAEQTPDIGFEGACGVALGAHADLYVSDYYHDAVDVFHVGAGGVEYLTQIANEGPTDGPCGLAVDSQGDVFVDNWRHGVVRFTPSAYPPGPGTTYAAPEVIDPGPATGVKFDPSSGRIYVDDGGYVAEYEPSGAPVVVGGGQLRIGLGTLGDGNGLAVSEYPATAGDVYVPDAADDVVKVFDPSISPTQPVQVIDGSGTPQVGFFYLGESEVAVSPADGHLFVLDGVGHDLSEAPEIAIDEFNSEGDYRGQILAPPPVKTKPAPGIPGLKPTAEGVVVHRMTEAEPSGLAIGPYVGQNVNEPDALYVSAGNSEGGAVWVFGARGISARTLSLARAGTGGGTVTSQPFGLHCGTACAAEYDEEQHVNLFANPDAHSDFTGWSVEGPGDEPCPGTGSCSVVMFGNVRVEADFERAPERPLQVSVDGDGAVTSDPAGISCPGQCSEEFAEGHTITLIAKPALHTRIVSWSGCSSEPDARECKVTVTEAKSVSVQFAPIPPRTLSVSVAGSGEVLSYPGGISCSSSCSGQFDEGGTVYLIGSPSPGWALGGWQGSGCLRRGLCAVTMSEAESVKAKFVRELPAAVSPPAEARGPSMLSMPRLSLRRVGVKGGVALAATVSSSGRLSIVNRWLRRTVVEPSAVGVATVPLRLNGSGRAALRRSKQHRLQVGVTVVFMPTFRGTPATATTRVTFWAGPNRERPRHSPQPE